MSRCFVFFAGLFFVLLSSDSKLAMSVCIPENETWAACLRKATAADGLDERALDHRGYHHLFLEISPSLFSIENGTA